ncbi:MAG: histidine kinase [Bacteroidetes Order II. Incertae sedis bacterium]|nr:histidine kinase [Bacteroidetes Order II. bacterium]
MDRIIRNSRLFIGFVGLVALLPLLLFYWSWLQVASDIQLNMPEIAYRGFDWVHWEFVDGQITATYVFPKGTAYEAGIRSGDVLTELDYIRYFDAEAFKIAVDAIQPGQHHRYTILRGTQAYTFDIRFTNYPIFIYPHTELLWNISLWGFLIIAFIHLMALGIILPLRNRSAKANLSIWLIGTASVAVFGNLIRLLMLALWGPSNITGVSYVLFQGLSLLGLLCWIGFPALLLHTVLYDRSPLRIGLRNSIWMLYIPAIVYGLFSVFTFFGGTFGPISHKNIFPPVLFYVYLFISASMALYLLLDRSVLLQPSVGEDRQVWSRIGSLLFLGLSVLMAVLVLAISRVLPLSEISDIQAGWILVIAQIFSTTPILLVSLAILKYGRVDEVISRYLSYAIGLLFSFFLFLIGVTFLPTFFPILPPNISGALWALCIILGFEWVVKRLQNIISRLIASEKRATQRSLNRFGEHMLNILDHQILVSQTLEKILEGVHTTSGALFLRTMNQSDGWIFRSVQPKPPYFSDIQMNRIWEELSEKESIWTSNTELSERNLSRTTREILRSGGFELVIPIPGNHQPIGLLLLGRKKRYRNFYNLSDLEMLRGLCNQLGLASERIVLVEREKTLVKQHAEAQLVALRAQISPHFLFNTLNTLAALIDENPKEAEKNIQHLAAIFRYVLQTGGNTFATLKEEFTLVAHYLALEQSRFGKDLIIQTSLPQEMEQMLIPAFALQTLVENAVKHGLEKNKRRGTLTIMAKQDKEYAAVISVYDSGYGIPILFGRGEQAVFSQPFFGTGLNNVKERLLQIYQCENLLTFQSDPEHGTTATLKIPLNTL